MNFRGVRLGLPVCEDTWTDWGDYENVVETLAETGAEILIVPNGSPYWHNKSDVRLNVAVARVTESGLPLVYVNQVGGQDELVFDGASFALNADRSIAFQLPAFRETVVTTHWSRTGGTWRCTQGPITPAEDPEQADYTACVLGLRDYVDKNRFKGVVLGLSGGIDSALCAAMATDALGADARALRDAAVPLHVARDSLDDAAAIAKTLGVNYAIVPIESAVQGLEAALAGVFAGAPRDVTEENLQARARGTILMAISNKFGAMVVTTGNKSEMSVGYATLYGDMNGGFNPIKDLYKTEVFRLARLRNRWKPDGALGPDGAVIPENVITRAPSAELRENQTDQDTLPPYDVLDQILERLVEREEPTATIVAAGFDRDTVMKVERMLYLGRIQAPPGGAGREGDAEEFRPRPALSDRQSVSRFRPGPAGARPHPGQGRGNGESGRGGFLIVPYRDTNGGADGRARLSSQDRCCFAGCAGCRRRRGCCCRCRCRCRRAGGRLSGGRSRRAFDRLGLRRLRQRLRVLVGDDDVAALQRRGVVGVLERVGPALARLAARAGRRELLAIVEGVRQRRIELAARRHRLLHVLARIVEAVERDFGRGAQPLARALVVGEAARHRRIRDREIVAVAGAHADRVKGAGRRAVAAGIEDGAAAEPCRRKQPVEEARGSGLVGGGGVLRAAIVLRQLADQRAALAVLVAGAALELLEIAGRAVEVAAHLLDLRGDRPALRRQAREQRQETLGPRSPACALARRCGRGRPAAWRRRLRRA